MSIPPPWDLDVVLGSSNYVSRGQSKLLFIATEHRRHSETNSVNGIEIAGKISSFFHVTGYGPIATQTGNGFGSPKLQYVLAVFAVNALGSRTPRFRIAEQPSIKSKNIIDGVSESNANCHEHNSNTNFDPTNASYSPITLLALASFYNLARYTRVCSCSSRDCSRPCFRGKISRAGFLCYETQHFSLRTTSNIIVLQSNGHTVDSVVTCEIELMSSWSTLYRLYLHLSTEIWSNIKHGR